MLFPLKQLIEERGTPLCIPKETKVADALAQMVEHDYSQLPIVDAQGDLIGIISEHSIIGTYYHIGGAVSLLDLTVDHCQTSPVTLTPESDIFEALDLLRTHYAVVIVDGQKPVGILTDYDTTHFFRDLSEGLILIEDIEVTLRQYTEAAFSDEKVLKTALKHAFGTKKNDPDTPARDYDHLAFGQQMQFMRNSHNWPKFNGAFEPLDLFLSLMDQVREIRNQLAHFRGRLDPVQRDALLRTRDWLASRPKLDTTQIQAQTIRISAAEVPPQRPSGKYAPLEAWLRERRTQASNIRVRFDDIEMLLEESLPSSAYEHRSWWSNDPDSHIQALAWMRAGWRTEDVDLSTRMVIFKRTDTVLQQLFFADLLARLKKARPGITRATKAYPQNWWQFGAGRTGFSFAWSFGKEDTLRVELYIDTEYKEYNKEAFDMFFEQREAIEQEIGATLHWGRLNHRRASRVALARPAKVTDSPEKLEQVKQWAIVTMLKFVDAFQSRIKEELPPL